MLDLIAGVSITQGVRGGGEGRGREGRGGKFLSPPSSAAANVKPDSQHDPYKLLEEEEEEFC